MKCPRTGTELKEVEIEGIKVDISEACGGVWFDNFELKHFDEVHESAGEKLIDLMSQYKTDYIDLSQRLNSPRHPEVVMKRRFFSPKRQIEIDECPQCGGIWLDAGELTKIRDLFPTEGDRKKAGKEFLDEVFENSEFKGMLKDSKEDKQKARRIANIFRWLCPSHYIPGKQDGGAF